LTKGKVKHWRTFIGSWLCLGEHQDLLHALVDAVPRGDCEKDGFVTCIGEDTAWNVDSLEDLSSVRPRHRDLDGAEVAGGIFWCGGGGGR